MYFGPYVLLYSILIVFPLFVKKIEPKLVPQLTTSIHLRRLKLLLQLFNYFPRVCLVIKNRGNLTISDSNGNKIWINLFFMYYKFKEWFQVKI